MPEFDLWSALPTLVPATWGLLVLLFAPLFRDDRRWLWICSVAGMALTLATPAYMLTKLANFGDVRETAGVVGLAMLRTDRLSLFMDVLFAIAGLGALLILPAYLERAKAHRPEIYPLVFFSVTGMTLMAGTENLVMMFLGLEVLSIPLYIMTGLTRDRAQATEGALKYFLLGAFSTGFLVYGLALVLGATGRFDLPGIKEALAHGSGQAPYSHVMLLAGLALILVAFAFKIGAVPFQFWVPDVYQGAPTPITGFMAVGTKAAAFAVLLRVLHTGFGSPQDLVDRWQLALSILAAVTMVGGNLLALVQQRLKRMLAYSSVAHAGYLILALLAPLPIGAKNLLFYLFAYGFMTLGAFAVVSLFLRDEDDADHIDQFNGLWQRRPLLAVSMGIFLLSLTGIPPMGGFIGKYVIFMAALEAGHPLLAAIMGVAAVIGAAYYLRVIVAMFLRPAESDAVAIKVPLGSVLVVGGSVIGTLLLGILPDLVLGPLSHVYKTLIPPP